jgi:hypothetical protein
MAMNRLMKSARNLKMSLKKLRLRRSWKKSEADSQKNSNDVDDKAKEDGDLDDIHGSINCNNCRKLVTSWNSGAVYLCYYCTELDLCEEVRANYAVNSFD